MVLTHFKEYRAYRIHFPPDQNISAKVSFSQLVSDMISVYYMEHRFSSFINIVEHRDKVGDKQRRSQLISGIKQPFFKHSGGYAQIA
ncbi:hypothetical protein D3C73_1286480 [compost metagenome]